MHLDVVDLKAFYYGNRLGRVAQRALRSQVQQIWPDARDQTVAGFGFATPMLRPYLNEARRIIPLMPAQQGAMHWPQGKTNCAVLSEETSWPLPTGFADKVMVLHGLESSDNPGGLLDEIWRVLTPGGRVLIIVPNRSGLWSRRDVTPFGHGRPYSLRQMEVQLKQHRFEPENHSAALFSPPSQQRFWLRTAPMWERFGQKISTHVAGGVILVEASKQVYAPTQKGLPEAVRRPLGVLEGIARPATEPVSGRAANDRQNLAD